MHRANNRIDLMRDRLVLFHMTSIPAQVMRGVEAVEKVLKA